MKNIFKTEKINYADLCDYIVLFKFNLKKVEDFKNNLKELLNYYSKSYEQDICTDIFGRLALQKQNSQITQKC